MYTKVYFVYKKDTNYKKHNTYEKMNAYHQDSDPDTDYEDEGYDIYDEVDDIADEEDEEDDAAVVHEKLL